MTLYMKVTSDKYELPIAVADSPAELALMLGLQKRSLWSIFAKLRKGIKGYKTYLIVEVDDDDD